GQIRELFVAPGHQNGAGSFHGDAGAVGVIAQQVVSTAYESGLQSAGFGVEPGVENGSVGLARALAHVVGRVDERDTQLVLAQGAGDRSTHDTGSDNGDVKIHAWSIRVRSASTAARHCRRKFL